MPFIVASKISNSLFCIPDATKVASNENLTTEN